MGDNNHFSYITKLRGQKKNLAHTYNNKNNNKLKTIWWTHLWIGKHPCGLLVVLGTWVANHQELGFVSCKKKTSGANHHYYMDLSVVRKN
jgi:hypothetical protein